MKRVIIAAVLTAAIFGISLAGCLTAVRITNIMENDLTELTVSCCSGDTENAVRLAEQTERHLNEYEKYLSFMLGDEKTSELSADIARLVPLAENDSGGLIAEASSIRRRISDIRTKEIPSWSNIL